MEMETLAKNLCAGAQIGPEQLSELAGLGFTDVVCNRPDEEHPDGPTSVVMAPAAKALGLAYHYLPISPGLPIDAQAARLAELTSMEGAQVFAYCRSGARSTMAWEAAQSVSGGHPYRNQ